MMFDDSSILLGANDSGDLGVPASSEAFVQKSLVPAKMGIVGKIVDYDQDAPKFLDILVLFPRRYHSLLGVDDLSQLAWAYTYRT
jgi:hypothetical protein